MSGNTLFQPTIPTEDEEQIAFVEWLELVGLRFAHIANSTYTKYMSVKMRNHRLGVRPGVPDMFVLIPPHRATDKQGHLVWIEMKRTKGGVVSPEQREWIAALNGLQSPHIEASVCKGWQAAKDTINAHLIDSPIELF